jgi:integrase
VAGK